MSRSEESVRYQRQLWRSRKWLQRRGRRNVRTVTTMTTMKTMKTSIPLCRDLSGKASRPLRSRLLEVLKSVPNARSGSPWCVGRRSIASTLLITVVETKYTVAADPPPGYLCHSCAKESNPFKKPTAPRKRKSAVEKRSDLNYQERKFPTLVSLCIKVRIILSFAPFLTGRSYVLDHFQTHK